MKQKKITSSLQGHVLEYLDYIWARKRFEHIPYIQSLLFATNRNVHYHSLLKDLSFNMQAEIAMAGTEKLLRKVRSKLASHINMPVYVFIP